MFPLNKKLEPPEVGQLKTVWQEVDALPEPSDFQHALNVFHRTFAGITASWLGSLLTVTTIAVTLFIISSVVFLFVHVEKYLATTGDQMTLSLYLEDQLGSDDLVELITSLEAIPVVSTVRYRSKEDALSYFREEMEEFQAYLSGIDEQRNPLPASLEIKFREGMSSPQEFQEIASRFRLDPRVDMALYNHDFMVRFHELFRRLVLLGVIGVCFLVGLSAWVIYNTIRFHVVSRKDDIQVQRYMGATRVAIRLPFLLEGALFGVVGAILALLALWLVVRLVYMHVIPDYLEFEWSFLGILPLFLLLLLGSAIGAMGSWFAVRRIREL